jgi:hypothetical protein
MTSQHTTHAARRLPLGILLVLIVQLALGAGPAAGAQEPWWHLSSRAAPTYLSQGEKEGILIVAASNLGDADATGAQAITITDQLPPGVIATAEPTGKASFSNEEKRSAQMMCQPLPVLSCNYTNNVEPYERLEVRIPVEITANAASGPNTVTVEGGGAASESLTKRLVVKNEATPFGPEVVELTPENEGGSEDTQAGSHPFQLTTTFDLNQTLEPDVLKENDLEPSAPALLKDVHFRLPPGLIGNPKATPVCSNLDFSTLLSGDTNLCPADSAVGAAVVTINEPVLFQFATEAVPVFNLAPAAGEPARFGFEVYNVPVILDTSVRPDGEYRVEVGVENAPQTAAILGSEVTFWGEPGSESHDSARGWACVQGGHHAKQGESCTAPSPRPTLPLLTLPTSCATALTTSAIGDSWLGESFSELSSSPTLGGCGALPFGPAIEVESETHTASSPTGLVVRVHVPQEPTLEAGKLAEADLRDTTVTLPAGVRLSPSAANGLQACSEEEIGFTGTNPQTQDQEFNDDVPTCPDASKVGIVHIKTPLLANELEGAVYLAAQDSNPFGSLVALYLVARDPVSGVLVKLAGEAKLDETTGQVTTSFANTPQLPFEELTLQLFNGPRASLTTPGACGSYTTEANFTPWSGGASVQSSSDPSMFDISAGPERTPCSSPQPFSPVFDAENASVQAGAFTPFSLTLAHPDADQPLAGLTVALPEGVAALLSTVSPCPEPTAGQQWACGPASMIGQSTAWSGLGGEPYALPGTVYLTTGYGGAPFGILVQTPAVAGPFDLGNVDVRSKIEVNPSTAAVTIVSDPFPQYVKGIPVQLKQINVTVDRADFEFNPTSCDPMKIEGTLVGAEGASESVSSPFQVQGCGGLPFAPRLTASAAGKGSKADGTSFAVTLESKGLGQANIAKVDLQLPTALSSRLPTLQKACLAAVFETNPAGCGEDSIIGTATIHTPVLKNPLTGPAYLVSHGAEFPDVEFVLQGEGITVILDGETDIKHGITYSRFETAPDAPFTRFETILPAGPHGVLTANVPEKEEFSLCNRGLSMPAEITSQAGTTIKQMINIAVTGCKGVAAYKATRAQLLAKALKACRKDVRHVKRQKCERAAQAKYGSRGKKAVRKK